MSGGDANPLMKPHKRPRPALEVSRHAATPALTTSQNTQPPQSPQLLLDGVRKSYPGGLGQPPISAVAGLWLRVRPGECFGLLVGAA
jgi:hypothetical protein